MNYTNNTQLHEIFFHWLTNGEQHKKMTGNEFSVTEALNDPYEIYLKRFESDHNEVDCQNLINSQSGTDWHKSMEVSAKALGYETEVELSKVFTTPKGRVVTLYGRCDAYKGDQLVDYKETKQATFEKNKSLESKEWYRQQLIYTDLLFDNKKVVISNMNILGKLKDVSAYREYKSGGNPYSGRCFSWDVNLDDVKGAISFALDNIDGYYDIVEKGISDVGCSPANRLNTNVYKIYKRKKENSDELEARAVTGCSSFSSFDEALDVATERGLSNNLYCIKEIKGDDIGCFYCEMKSVCPYIKSLSKSEVL